MYHSKKSDLLNKLRQIQEFVGICFRINDKWQKCNRKSIKKRLVNFVMRMYMKRYQSNPEDVQELML